MGKALSPEERHEWSSERLKAFIEGFQRMFATDGITQQDYDKVNQIVMPKSATSEAHSLFNRRKPPRCRSTCATTATSPNHGGVEGTDWEVV
jgi:hypothetical protein